MGQGLKKPIHIHVHLGEELGIPVKSQAKPQHIVEQDKLLVRLNNRHVLSEQKAMRLTQDVVDYAKDRLAKKDFSSLKRFLKDASKMFTPEMRDAVSDELKLLKLTNKTIKG